MLQKNNKTFFILLLFFISFFVSLKEVSAATLNFYPISETYSVGDVIKIDVFVSSKDPINAVAGKVSFSSDVLSFKSVSRETSIIDLWTYEPSYSKESGLISFEGVVFNGYSGVNGNIMTLFFNVDSPGKAVLKFSEISILANDGNGTNIFSGEITNGFINIEKEFKSYKKEPIISCISSNNSGKNFKIEDSKIKYSVACIAINATEKIREIEISNDLISHSLLLAVIIIFVIVVCVIIIYFFLLIFRLKRYFKFNLLKIESLVLRNFNKLDGKISLIKNNKKDKENDIINIETRETKEKIIEEIEEIKNEA